MGSGLLPGQSSHLSSDSCQTHVNIDLCRMQEALSMIDLMMHPETWHSSFREDKGQNFQVSYFLCQQHQWTCSESLFPATKKVQRLRWGKLARTRFEHCSFLVGSRRDGVSKNFSPWGWSPVTFLHVFLKCNSSWSLPWPHYLKLQLILPLLMS